MYDVIIIGMGISGISCGIYLKRAGYKVLMLEESALGGTINKIDMIENYPGILKISGPDLAYQLFETVKKLEIEYKIEKVTDVIFDDIKTIKTNSGVYQAKKVVIASGRRPKYLGLKDEEKLLGKGISTCALCDGAFFKGKDVAVVGGGSSALSEACYLARIVNKVYLIHRRDEFRGEKILIENVVEQKNIEILLNQEVKELKIEDDKLKGIVLNNNKTILVEGLFLYIGFVPNTEFLENTEVKLNDHYIIVDKTYETNVKGVYAVGDVIQKDVYQIVSAASEGASAAIHITKSN